VEQCIFATANQIHFVPQERERMFGHDLRRVKGLEIRKMAKDGNCLFRAVADQVYGDAEAYDVARQMCVDYMVQSIFPSVLYLFYLLLLISPYNITLVPKIK
jgi:hypothetical protein